MLLRLHQFGLCIHVIEHSFIMEINLNVNKRRVYHTILNHNSDTLYCLMHSLLIICYTAHSCNRFVFHLNPWRLVACFDPSEKMCSCLFLHLDSNQNKINRKFSNLYVKWWRMTFFNKELVVDSSQISGEVRWFWRAVSSSRVIKKIDAYAPIFTKLLILVANLQRILKIRCLVDVTLHRVLGPESGINQVLYHLDCGF